VGKIDEPHDAKRKGKPYRQHCIVTTNQSAGQQSVDDVYNRPVDVRVGHEPTPAV
jgi:hypothetical protein